LIAHYIHTTTAFIAAHPQWIGFTVFVATALESMAFIGSIIPGMSFVIALCGVAASLGVSVLGLVLWCTLGAIVGDGLSYWLGHIYGDRLKSTWPFRTRPELLDMGVEFFERNGGKSIFIGRFLPFTRAIVPVVAGMLDMSPVNFYVANILSAIVWALMNVIPAAGLGLAFTVINQSSSRMAVMLGVFIVVLAAAMIASHVTARLLLPWLGALLFKMGAALRRRSGAAARLAALIFGANRHPTTAGAAWVVFTVGLMVGFAKVLEDVSSGEPLVRADVALNHLTQGLRTPVGDKIMVALTTMGDTTVLFSAAAIVLGGLLAVRAWRTFALALLSLSATTLFVYLLKWALHKPRPIDIYSGPDAFSFPSGHAAFAAIVWGLITVIGTRGLSRKNRATAWALAFSLSALIGLSRVYLSAHWPSDVIGGLLCGWTMAGVFGLFEHQMEEQARHPGRIGLAATMGLALVWGVHGTVSFNDNLARYAPRENIIAQSMSHWLDTGWRDASNARIDLLGEFEEPLAFQIATTPAAIETVLQDAGWSPAPIMSVNRTTQFFNGTKDLSALAPLPLLHNGQAAVLTMIDANTATGASRDVVRLWNSSIRIDTLAGKPELLLASITRETVEHPVKGVNVIRARPAPLEAVQHLAATFKATPSISVFPPMPANTPGVWRIAPHTPKP
jgi:undecaprenyl-diphosphatase